MTQRRKALKVEAMQKYEEAKEKEDTEAMKKYASRTSRLTSDIIEESKKIIDALGLPIIFKTTKGEKERELKDLRVAIKEAKQKYKIQGIVSGALASNYQKTRVFLCLQFFCLTYGTPVTRRYLRLHFHMV